MPRFPILAVLVAALAALAFSPTASATYDPVKGRWLERDPLDVGFDQAGFLKGTDSSGYREGANLFQYCRSSPISRSDPLGLASDVQPNLPIPLPPGSRIVFPFQSLDGLQMPCGSVRLSAPSKCTASVKFEGFCPLEKAGFALAGGDLCKMLNETIKEYGGRFVRHCAGKNMCCLNKAVFAGSYPVLVTGEHIRLSDTCKVTFSIELTIEITGEIGFCKCCPTS